MGCFKAKGVYWKSTQREYFDTTTASFFSANEMLYSRKIPKKKLTKPTQKVNVRKTKTNEKTQKLKDQ